MDKIKRVKVLTPSGDKFIIYRPLEEIPTDKLICDENCPYGKSCGKLPDPRDPDNEELSFTDFCNSLGENEGDSESLVSMVPAEGELENLFKDREDILQIILENNPVYSLTNIIDSCCPDMCESYDKSHSYCTLENKMCILRPLLCGAAKKFKKNKSEE